MGRGSYKPRALDSGCNSYGRFCTELCYRSRLLMTLINRLWSLEISSLLQWHQFKKKHCRKSGESSSVLSMLLELPREQHTAPVKLLYNYYFPRYCRNFCRPIRSFRINVKLVLENTRFKSVFYYTFQLQLIIKSLIFWTLPIIQFFY
jgi:hypothetical protein